MYDDVKEIATKICTALLRLSRHARLRRLYLGLNVRMTSITESLLWLHILSYVWVHSHANGPLRAHRFITASVFWLRSSHRLGRGSWTELIAEAAATTVWNSVVCVRLSSTDTRRLALRHHVPAHAPRKE
jgi:hypothetical protein